MVKVLGCCASDCTVGVAQSPPAEIKFASIVPVVAPFTPIAVAVVVHKYWAAPEGTVVVQLSKLPDMEASAKVYTILLSGTAGAELPLELLLYKVIVVNMNFDYRVSL